MIKKPLVSICCLTFNHEKFLRATIEGFLIQMTSFPFEIIIHDDASTDGTVKIINEYTKLHPKLITPIFQTVNQYSKGVKPYFNFLIPKASGKYIANCEGDDYWTDPHKLQKQVDFLEANQDFSLCFHNVNILNNRNGSSSLKLMHNNMKQDVFTTKDILTQWFIPTASIVFKRDSNFNLPDWYYNCASGDIPLLLLLSLKGKFKYLDEVMGCYRLHDNGISTTHSGYSKAFSMIYIYQHFDEFTNYQYHDKITEAMIYELRRHMPEMKELRKYKLQEERDNRSLLVKIKSKIGKFLN